MKFYVTNLALLSLALNGIACTNIGTSKSSKATTPNTGTQRFILGSPIAGPSPSLSPSLPVSTVNSVLEPVSGVPPLKIDLLVGIGSEKSMANVAPNLQKDLETFLAQLKTSGWDYRIIALPLNDNSGTTLSLDHQVTTSSTDLAANPTLFSTQLTLPTSTEASDGHEAGIKSEVDFLQRSDVRARFLRSDALLGVLNVSLHDDHSGGTWTNPWGNTQVWNPNENSNLTNFESALVLLKSGADYVKYYSLVAHDSTTCRGFSSRSGIRYEQLASDLNGISVDLCTQTTGQGLSQILQSLESRKLTLVQKYFVLPKELDTTLLKITKTSDADPTHPVDLKQDAEQGWTYVGYRTNQGIYENDTVLNIQSGYFFELHGSAKLKANDQLTISTSSTPQPN